MKIIHEKQKCIGCGACVAICPDFWEMGDGGLAHLKGARENSETGNDELEISDAVCNREAVDSCPVQIIKIA